MSEHHHGDAIEHDENDILQMLTQEFWDDRYGTAESIWSGDPNPQLVAEVGGLAPGTAIDIGSGEGADAIWLAGRGWQVTGLDVSQVALDRGAARARSVSGQVADRITWERADILTWRPTTTYDLVSAQFMHLPQAEMLALVGRLASAVNVGGSLLIVGHHPADLETTMQRPNLRMLYTAEELSVVLAQEWRILLAGARERTATDPEGRQITISDAILHAVRL